MISIETTFVVGAGASVPYGLPTAAELHTKALALREGHPVFRLLSDGLRRDVHGLKNTLKDLRHHPAQSIDAFLEARHSWPEVVRTGKLLIAALLGIEIRESANREVAPAEDWLGYIVDKMRKGARTPEDFISGNAGVRFVTFNFDSNIETRFERAVCAIYRGNSIDLSALHRAIPIIHVHGVLPDLPDDFAVLASGAYTRDTIQWLEDSATRITVVSEALDDKARSAAVEAVISAKHLCFLGFAYDPDNLARIGLPRRLKGMGKKPADIFGSAKGLRRGEQNIVKRYFHDVIQLADEDMGCRDALRYLDVFKE
ncbi:MAG TPA: hypothetical protein VG871_11820 [Vicinamibacterales bacterium]|nr:hypothetical protein [Vicinamibacterales bacterium]